MKELFRKNPAVVLLILAFLVLIVIGIVTTKAAEPQGQDAAVGSLEVTHAVAEYRT